MSIIQSDIISINSFNKNVVDKMYDSSVYEDVILEKIVYESDGLKVNGYIARPKTEGIYPLILWNRGGYKDDGGITDLTAHLILSSTARWGYIVAATQYRGNMGSEGKEDWGGKDLDDALNLLELAMQLPYVDSSRIAIEGASRGGMTTYRALAQVHDFKCAIVHAGVTDLFEMENYRDDFKQLIYKITADMMPDEKRNWMSSRSAVDIAGKFSKDTPILLMHGSMDRIVPITQTESLVKELKALDISHKFEIIPNGDHVALRDGSYQNIDPIRKEWLKKFL